MFETRHKLVPQMSVVNEMATTFGNGDLAKGRLQGDPVRLPVFYEPIPPARSFFDDLVQLRLRYAVREAGFDQHFPADTVTSQSFGHGVGQFFAATRGALIDSDDGHG